MVSDGVDRGRPGATRSGRPGGCGRVVMATRDMGASCVAVRPPRPVWRDGQCARPAGGDRRREGRGRCRWGRAEGRQAGDPPGGEAARPRRWPGAGRGPATRRRPATRCSPPGRSPAPARRSRPPRQPGRAARVEPPLQHVAFDDERPGTTPCAARWAAGRMSTSSAPPRYARCACSGSSRRSRARAAARISSMPREPGGAGPDSARTGGVLRHCRGPSRVSRRASERAAVTRTRPASATSATSQSAVDEAVAGSSGAAPAGRRAR